MDATQLKGKSLSNNVAEDSTPIVDVDKATPSGTKETDLDEENTVYVFVNRGQNTE